MPTHLESLIEQSAAANRFPPSSRYHGVPLLEARDASGRPVLCASRRFLPEADAASASVHVITQGERPDQLASRYLGDPQRYWEICDNNTGKQPWQLASVAGEIVLIPEGGVRQAGGGAFYPI